MATESPEHAEQNGIGEKSTKRAAPATERQAWATAESQDQQHGSSPEQHDSETSGAERDNGESAAGRRSKASAAEEPDASSAQPSRAADSQATAPSAGPAAGSQATAPSAGPAAGSDAREHADPDRHAFDSGEEVRAALAAWTGRRVGDVTPEEGRRRGYRPSGDKPAAQAERRASAGREERPRDRGRPSGRNERGARPAPREAREEAGPEQAGRIKWFNMETGYGFIQPEGGGDDVFVHLNQFRERPEQVRHGARVAFRVGSGRRGRPEAKEVMLSNQPARAPERQQSPSESGSGEQGGNGRSTPDPAPGTGAASAESDGNRTD